MNHLLLQAMTSKYVDRWMTKLLGPFVTIYTLHRPSPANRSFHGIDEELLDRSLQFAVERGYCFASIDELVEAAVKRQELTHPTLCFTLDDGYADQLTRLVPVLLKYQAKPTLFTITDFVDRVDWPWDAKVSYITWNTRQTHFTLKSNGVSLELNCSSAGHRVNTRRTLSRHAKTLNRQALNDFLEQLQRVCDVVIPEQAPEEYAPASWKSLREYEAQGLRIGAHSRSHLVLSALSDEEILQELTYSKNRVETELTNPSRVFCYPSGTARDFSVAHPRLVEQVGFSSAITTISKPTNLHLIRNNLYQIDRIGFPETFDKFVRYSSWIEVLRNKLS